MEQTERNKFHIGRIFRAAPVGHAALLAGVLCVAAFFAARGSGRAMQLLWGSVARPWHRTVGGLCAAVPFSVAELLDALLALALLGALVWLIVSLVRAGNGRRGCLLYRAAVGLLALLVLLYAGYCLFWGCGYETPTLEERMGIDLPGVAAEDLVWTTAYFAACANYYGQQVPRDGQQLLAASRSDILAAAPLHARNLAEVTPALDGVCHAPKPIVCSRVMSVLDFTGFFFPFTGEANVNMDSPVCLLASTASHELAHQLGVTAEQEANFVAVLSCMESGDPVYAYSGSLLAYLHLSNALYRVQPELWRQIAVQLSEPVRADLAAHSAYWQAFRSPITTASNTVYNGFLQSYGQTLGLQSYGACVDFLVYWYGGTAAAAMKGQSS